MNMNFIIMLQHWYSKLKRSLQPNTIHNFYAFFLFLFCFIRSLQLSSHFSPVKAPLFSLVERSSLLYRGVFFFALIFKHKSVSSFHMCLHGSSRSSGSTRCILVLLLFLYHSVPYVSHVISSPCILYMDIRTSCCCFSQE